MRAYVSPEEWSESGLELSPEESHHLSHVLRVSPGQEIDLFDGCGRTARAAIKTVNRHHVAVEVLSVENHEKAAHRIVLYQAVLKAQMMDFLVQKITELGVHRLVPITTENTVVRVADGKDAAKSDRWRRIMINAAKQCGSCWLPELAPSAPLGKHLSPSPDLDLLVLCDISRDAEPLKQRLRVSAGDRPRSIGALIGPEGDFTTEEKEAAREAGAIAVSLGSQVLRAETAALYVVSALHYELSLQPSAVE